MFRYISLKLVEFRILRSFLYGKIEFELVLYRDRRSTGFDVLLISE